MNWEQLKNLKISRRQAITGGVIIGIGLVGVNTETHPFAKGSQPSPFKEGEEVNPNQLRSKREVLEIIKATAEFPIVEITENDTDLSGLPQATRKKLNELKINDFDMIEGDLKGDIYSGLEVNFSANTTLGKNFSTHLGETPPPVFCVFYDDRVLKKKRGTLGSRTNVFYDVDTVDRDDQTEQLKSGRFLFNFALGERANQYVVFLFNKGFTTDINSPTFLPVRFLIKPPSGQQAKTLIDLKGIREQRDRT
ncbi:MAG TPA: hypothetical protein VG917_05220 [Patescibacteria group bacterium]|nr:hypothetical protein [Patescibacteria group bacterium]